MTDTSKVPQRQAHAMGKPPSVGSAGGNPFKRGAAAQGSGSQAAKKMPATTHTHAKPKGGK